MASSTSNFIVGVKSVDGNPSNPSFSFLNDRNYKTDTNVAIFFLLG